jgi:xanthine dehydrogenase small subunit
VTKIKIPLLNKFEKIKLYKVSMRKDLDISAVTFAGRFTIENKIIKVAKIALGGVAATVLRLFDLEKKLIGKEVSEKNFIDVANELDQFIFPLSDLRASKEYRMIVAKNFFKKCVNELESEG